MRRFDLTLAVLLAACASASAVVKNPLVGHDAPSGSLDGVNVAGKVVVGDAKGKVLVVSFFAGWSPATHDSLAEPGVARAALR